MTSDQENPATKLAFVNDAADVPTISADHCIFMSRFMGNVRLSFVESIIEPPGFPEPRIKTRWVGHIVMPEDGLRNMLRYLNTTVGIWDQSDGSAD